LTADTIKTEESSMSEMPTLSRDNLSRIVEFRANPSPDGLTLEGYAAVFNQWTTIDSYEGTFRERIAPGAFKRTLGQRMPVLQFDHGTHPLIGSIPLGRITSITEDDHGLKVRARLSDNWLVEPVRDAIRDGAIDGMSFRFSVPANGDHLVRGDDGMVERTINEIALYEVGPVVFPAYEQTTVGVRSRAALDALTDPEVRSEIARILASGTDLRSLATDPDPNPPVHSEPSPTTDPVTTDHSEPSPTRTKAQREALVAIHLQN
jgi:HK97 family phage prohead protease